MFVANALVSGDVMNSDVPLGRCQGSKDRRKRIELALTIYRVFMQGPFYQVLSGGRGDINLELPGQ